MLHILYVDVYYVCIIYHIAYRLIVAEIYSLTLNSTCRRLVCFSPNTVPDEAFVSSNKLMFFMPVLLKYYSRKKGLTVSVHP